MVPTRVLIMTFRKGPVPLSPAQRAQYAPLARLIRTPGPDGIEALEPGTFTAESADFKATTLARRYAWARGLTLMRERQAAETGARVVIGGMVGPTEKAMADGSHGINCCSGRIPGVVEEALLTLRGGKA